MGYGTPTSLDDVERYLTHIRNGRRPQLEEIAELRNRYAAIGGKSPLLEILLAQAAMLEQELKRRGWKVKSLVGLLHSPPFIEDVVQRIVREGFLTLVSLPMTPYYSRLSAGKYEAKIAGAVDSISQPPNVIFVGNWNTHPQFIQAWAEKVKAALAHEGGDPRSMMVVFTAHSLPRRILDLDPYSAQIEETCRLVAQFVGIHNWTLAYQSVGMSGGEWLGPELLDKLFDLKEKGFRDFLIVPIGFVSDHLEVLYDIDIECKEFAVTNSIRVQRTESLNTSATFIGALATIVEERLRSSRGSA